MFKNKIYSLALKELKRNPGDLRYFTGELSNEIKKDPSLFPSYLVGSSKQFGDKKFGPDPADEFNWLQDLKFKTILDVGAWKGDSAKRYREMFPDAQIYSFEPLAECFAELNSLQIENFRAFNFALGGEEATMKINKSGFSPSSSLLKMSDIHKEAFPFTAEETEEEIHVRTLDSFLSEMELKENVMMKVDVQGFEEHVLDGATNTLDKVKFIVLEISFEPIYVGCPSFDALYKRLTTLGFEYRGSWNQLKRPQDGLILSQNAIFIRP